MTTLLVTVCAAGIGGGLVLVWSALLGRPVAPAARPPGRLAAWARWPRDPSRQRAALAATATGLVVLAVTRWPAAAIAAGVGAVALPAMLSRRPVTAQLERLDAIEGWVRKLAGLLGASRGLEDTLQTSERHCPTAIAPQVSALTRRLRAGMPTDQALYRFADDIADPVGDLVAGALIHACQVRGRGVAGLLTELAAMVAADVTGRREVEAARAPLRTTLRGLTVIFTLFGLALALRHDYSAPYGTVLGQVVLTGVLAVCGTGLWVMHRLANQAPVDRFLTNPTLSPAQTERLTAAGSAARRREAAR